jgi:xylulokinase
VDVFSEQGRLTTETAGALGLEGGIPVSYRAGDQPNNAFSLNVLKQGEIAATAGTSGVIYGISAKPSYDPESRVNTFIHVNHSSEKPRYGVLLCINGTGIMNSWLKHQTGSEDYQEMNRMASHVQAGSDGVRVFPFGNGAERVLNNRNPGAMIYGLDLNRHRREHLLRAAQEGIVFSLNYGFDIMKKMGMSIDIVRAGEANMFLSPVFREIFVNTTETIVELYNTDGSQGAARAAGLGAGIYSGFNQAFSGLKKVAEFEPEIEKVKRYKHEYNQWLNLLNDKIL